ncbi:MAG: hypothetical protein R2883_04835 [Caldisericia bacterium]
MKNIWPFIVCVIVVLMIGCSTEKVYYSSEDILEPYQKGEEVNIPDPPPEIVVDVEYTDNPLWADNLSMYVPVFSEPKFHPQKEPAIFELPLEQGRISIKGETYHKNSSELMYTWFADNLEPYGLMINRNLPDNEDPLIYIPQDGSGSLQVTDGYYNLKISITPLTDEPGWVQVEYDGSVLK